MMRKIILATTVICYILTITALFTSCDGSTEPSTLLPQPSHTPTPTPQPKPSDVNGTKNWLFIPPILEDEDPNPTSSSLNLIVQESTKEFLQGKETKTYGYNGDYLGPTIRVRRGEHVDIKVLNNLAEETTVHWHDLLVEGEMDGGPHQIILPRNEWNPNFIINQPTATLWYHAHPMHRTGGQVYRGLAGLFIIDDNESERLNLPNEYGVNDIPLSPVSFSFIA